MDKKKIAAIPHGEAEQTGRWVKAQLIDGDLVLDCFESRKYIGRYCLQKTGRYDFYSAKDAKWTKRGLNILYGNPWYWSAEIKCSRESEKIITEFTGFTGYGYGNMGIDRMERNYNGEKREAAFLRKKDRIEAKVNTIPALPDEFYGWLNETIFEGKEYMFKTSATTWKCTACGKMHTSKKPYKNNQIVKCSRTGKAVTVRSRNQPVKRKEPVMIFQQTTDPRRSVARHFAAERIWSDEENTTKAYENVRCLLGKNTESDYDTGDLVPGVEWYYGQFYRADEFKQEWWDTNKANKHCNSEYCYPVGVKEALKDTQYEKMHLEAFTNLGWKLQYNKMMINHSDCGFMEYLAKAGLKKMTEEQSENFSTWGGWYGKINIHGRNATEVLGIDMQRFHRLRQADGGSLYLEWLWHEQKSGKNIPEKTIQFMDRNGIKIKDIEFMQGRMTPVQVANYLERQAAESKKSPHALLGYWKDYLSMAERLEMDVSDEIVYRTKNLLQRHDELVEVISSMNAEEQAEKMREKYPNAETVMQKIKERYEYENDKYLLIVPQKIQDIMRDGRQLHHCAASSERYFERIEKQETYIMFLRKKTRPLWAWYTLEVEPGGTVRQKRSEFNRQPELDEVKRFISEWQRVLKTRMKQEDRALADRSRKMRITEMQELKNNNMLFAGVLEADLMEVV